MKRMLVNRCEEYNEYLEQHIGNVARAWFEILRPIVEKEDSSVNLSRIDRQIVHHDASKYYAEEYEAYRRNFYPREGEEPDQKGFDKAWLHHIHHNPHHWQYWVLINDTDEPKVHPLDMELPFVFEMLCDWHSFSAKDKNSTANNWWTNHRDDINVSDRTAEIIDKYAPMMEALD